MIFYIKKKREKKLKKYIAGTLAIMMIGTGFIPLNNTEAYEIQTSQKQEVKLNSKEMKDYIKVSALEWAGMIEPDLNLKVKNIQRIVTDDRNEIEYSVSYYCGKEPYGYAILQWIDGDFVVLEGVLEKNQQGVYEEITENIENEENLNGEEIGEELVKISGTQYGVVTENRAGKDITYDNFGNQQPVVKSEQYALPQSIFIEKGKFEAGVKYKILDSIELKKYKNRSQLFDKNATKEITGKYACAIQSLLQISYMENLCSTSNSSIKKTYNELWKKCKTSYDSSDGQYGNTIEDAAKGFVSFAKSKGYKGTAYKGEKRNPSVAWLKDKLEFNRPIIMGYTINANGYDSSHAISILGWYKAKKVSSGNTYNYLKVYDAWREKPYYLNYTTVDFSKYCSASYFWVKK